MKICNFGSMNIDNVFRVDEFIRPGESKIASGLEVTCGGKGLNQSIACARAGIETHHIGFVGPDGGMLRDKLREAGVHTDRVLDSEERTGCTAIQINDAGQNCILVYGGTNRCYTEEFIDEVLGEMTAEDVLLLQNEISGVGYILRRAGELGIRVAFNAAPYTEDLQSYPVGNVTWLIVNEVEGVSLAGWQDLLDAEDTDYESVLDELRDRFPETEILLTLGAQGCLYDGREGRIRMPARKVRAVDTTAAGDTFIGFFLGAVLQGASVRDALRAATNASSLAVMSPGAADAIPSATVEELLAME